MRTEAIRACAAAIAFAGCGASDLHRVGEDTGELPVAPDDTALPPLPTDPPVINELLANEAAGEDWIELYAPGDEDLSLDGYAVTTNLGDPRLAPLPVGLVLPAHGYIVLNAAGDAAASDIALTLPIQGDLGLFYGFSPVELHHYEAQSQDISAARVPDGGGTWGNDATPTPGLPNDL
jgi:hypothetical protein